MKEKIFTHDRATIEQIWNFQFQIAELIDFDANLQDATGTTDSCDACCLPETKHDLVYPYPYNSFSTEFNGAMHASSLTKYSRIII